MSFSALGRQLGPVLFLLATVACGYWPPVVETRADVERLPVTQADARVRFMQDDDIGALERLKGLKWLDFTGGWRLGDAPISDRGLADLARLNLPALEILSLGFCPNVTDAGMASVARLEHLRRLSLMGSRTLTDDGLRHLVLLRDLEELDLRGCTGVTDRGLELLATKRNWKHIDLGGCQRISAAGVTALRQRLPDATVEKDDEAWEYFLRH